MECNPLLKIDAGFFKIRAPVPSKLALEAPKIEVGDVPESEDAPKRRPRPAKRRPRAPKRRPRSAQERPRDAQETPKRGRETPNPLQNRAWQDPERVPDAFGSVRGHIADPSSKKRSPKPLRTTFACFFSMIAKSVNLDFYRPCRCFRRFFKNACCSIDVGATREKRSKNLRRKPLKPSLDTPGALQNRARSAPEHQEIDRDGQEWLGWLHKWASWGQQWVHGGPNGWI